MKKILIGLGVAMLVVGAIGYWIYSQGQNKILGRSNFVTNITLAGSSSNYVSLPRTAVFDNSTTTDATNSFAAGAQNGYLDGGATITQAISTGDLDWVNLEVAALGGTATSTMYVRLQLYDGTDWSDVHPTSTAVFTGNNTSTVFSLKPRGFNVDPGRASTTLFRYPFDVYGSKQARFIMYADDLTTDPNDGVQVWVKALKISEQ